VLAVDCRDSFRLGGLMAEAKRAGRGLGVMDGWIAATAKVLDLALVTQNIKDFDQLGVSLLVPWTDPGLRPI
jgi:predicted nucleic acid-binding protein